MMQHFRWTAMHVSLHARCSLNFSDVKKVQMARIYFMKFDSIKLFENLSAILKFPYA